MFQGHELYILENIYFHFSQEYLFPDMQQLYYVPVWFLH